MFSSLISFIKKKKQDKKEKNEKCRRVSSTASITEEALEILGREHADEHSTSSIASKIYPPLPSPQIATLTLLKGSSESRPAEDKGASPKVEKTKINLTPREKLMKLYPDLQNPEASTSRMKIPIAKKCEEKLKKIHDFGGEIPCIIEPNILNAEERIWKIKKLRNEMKKKLLAIMTLITNPPQSNYDFNRELKVKENSPADIKTNKYYKNIQTFDQLKIYCKSIENNKKKNITSKNIRNKETIEIPLFQSFSKTFKCYRGKSNDVVNCP